MYLHIWFQIWSWGLVFVLTWSKIGPFWRKLWKTLISTVFNFIWPYLEGGIACLWIVRIRGLFFVAWIYCGTPHGSPATHPNRLKTNRFYPNYRKIIAPFWTAVIIRSCPCARKSAALTQNSLASQLCFCVLKRYGVQLIQTRDVVRAKTDGLSRTLGCCTHAPL